MPWHTKPVVSNTKKVYKTRIILNLKIVVNRSSNFPFALAVTLATAAQILRVRPVASAAATMNPFVMEADTGVAAAFPAEIANTIRGEL